MAVDEFKNVGSGEIKKQMRRILNEIASMEREGVVVGHDGGFYLETSYGYMISDLWDRWHSLLWELARRWYCGGQGRDIAYEQRTTDQDNNENERI